MTTTTSSLRISPLVLPGCSNNTSMSSSSSSSPIMSSSPISSTQTMNALTIASEAKNEFASLKTAPSIFSYKIPHYKCFVSKTDEVFYFIFIYTHN